MLRNRTHYPHPKRLDSRHRDTPGTDAVAGETPRTFKTGEGKRCGPSAAAGANRFRLLQLYAAGVEGEARRRSGKSRTPLGL